MSKFEYDIYKIYEEYEGQNKRKTEIAKGGLNFLEALLLVFIILKLCGIINWSWWWVLTPMWIPIGLWLILIIVTIFTQIFYKSKHK